jgi:hypothetical protein
VSDDALGRAVEFLADLEEDCRSAPAEFVALVEAYLPALRTAIHRMREQEIGARELDAAVLQIRMSYARDLQRQLGEERPTARFTRED